jgi:endonuclease YncB( thermonuclease family)
VLIDGQKVHAPPQGNRRSGDEAAVREIIAPVVGRRLRRKRARVLWTQKDRNSRILGRVWCSGIDANAEQVRRGMAWVFDRYVKDRNLYQVQDMARAQRVSLWADAEATPPWRWREINKASRAASGESN